MMIAEGGGIIEIIFFTGVASGRLSVLMWMAFYPYILKLGMEGTEEK